jgi:hypothetical protein
LNPKLALRLAARMCELRARGTVGDLDASPNTVQHCTVTNASPPSLAWAIAPMK